MYHIVAGIDDDEAHATRCAEAAIDLPSESPEKQVTLIHSFDDNPSGASASQVQSVRTAAELLEEHDIDTNIQESSGDPADAIIDTAVDDEADLILIGGRKRSPAGKALFGSVTQSVILGSTRPVMVTGVDEE